MFAILCTTWMQKARDMLPQLILHLKSGCSRELTSSARRCCLAFLTLSIQESRSREWPHGRWSATQEGSGASIT